MLSPFFDELGEIVLSKLARPPHQDEGDFPFFAQPVQRAAVNSEHLGDFSDRVEQPLGHVLTLASRSLIATSGYIKGQLVFAS